MKNKYRKNRQEKPTERIPPHRWNELIEYLCETDDEFSQNWKNCIKLRASEPTKKQVLRAGMRQNRMHIRWFFDGKPMPFINNVVLFPIVKETSIA